MEDITKGPSGASSDLNPNFLPEWVLEAAQNSRALFLDNEELRRYALALEKTLIQQEQEVFRLVKESKADYWIERMVKAQEAIEDEKNRASKIV